MRVRTKAEPLPGFTCWNSTISKGSLSISILSPRRNAPVSIVSLIASLLASLKLLLDLGAGDPKKVARLAVVALRLQGDHHKIFRRDEPGHREDAVGVDAE